VSLYTAPLGDVCEIKMGQAPSGDTYNVKGHGLPLIAGAGDFGARYPEPTKFTSAPTKVSRQGDIILCIRATIGDRNWSDTEYCLGRGVAGLTGREKLLDQQYLWHWLGHAAPDLKLKGRGATFLQVNKADIASLEIPLPSLAEQRRIAAILNKADALRAKRREAIAKLDKLLQSVFFDMFGDPVPNSKGWPLVPFTEVGEWKSGSTPSKGESTYWNGTFPWVSPKDMKVGRITDAQDHVSELAFEATNLKRIEPGHLLIVVRGMILAHSFPTALNVVPVAINQDMKAIEPTDGFDVAYLKAAVDSLKPRILSAVSSAGHGTCRLSTQDASEVMVPMPPKRIQERFGQNLGVLLSLCDQAALQLDSAGELFAALQMQAFSGALSQ
jgi:type I restriction enzyme S subunit